MGIDMDETLTNSTEKSTKTWLSSLGRILAWLALFGLLVVVALVLFRKSQGPVTVGAKPPSFTLTTFDGSNHLVAPG